MKRINAWTLAAELVDPIVELHGLEDFNSGANTTIFSSIGGSHVTKVDQHISHIMNVAEWLLKKKEE